MVAYKPLSGWHWPPASSESLNLSMAGPPQAPLTRLLNMNVHHSLRAWSGEDLGKVRMSVVEDEMGKIGNIPRNKCSIILSDRRNLVCFCLHKSITKCHFRTLLSHISRLNTKQNPISLDFTSIIRSLHWQEPQTLKAADESWCRPSRIKIIPNRIASAVGVREDLDSSFWASAVGGESKVVEGLGGIPTFAAGRMK
jgi:hypothetical protein